MAFPLSEPLTGRILVVGGIYVDLLNEVPAFPEEDSSQRAVAYRRSRGGNAANSSVVLADLLTAAQVGCCVSWVGAVPRADEPDTAFALADLKSCGVETSLMEEVGGEAGQPSAFIIKSMDTGSRTIISHRRGLRELDAGHFARSLRRTPCQAADLGNVCWVHFECRMMPDVLHMAEAVHAWASETQTRPMVSLEVEKPGMQPEQLVPLLLLCDLAYFSREFVERHREELKRAGVDGSRGGDADEHLALRCLRGLRAWVGDACKALWICPWGSLGAFALDCATGQAHFQAARKLDKVVDSVGAGDTFVAACIFALLRGADAATALLCGCSVAGQKVAQEGLSCLSVAVPPRLAQGGASFECGAAQAMYVPSDEHPSSHAG
uniref:Carbohydrate kinase PfkB domain-containing protein n=1 Tax=Alexandrium monilatum TaxID=311494 RepID=A0A7S4RZS6_9DINO|mmetsp:Transcript_22341/g.67120  ORF Transcript_22341/g.67120 Transcript_22341/m.67120 type:complete len:380 (-) Transcript_22341:457-1596(-)